MNQLRTTIVARLQSRTGLTYAHRQLLLSAGWVCVLSVLVKLAAMTKDIFIGLSFGAGDELDALILALALPMFTLAVVAQTFSLAFIPALIHAQEQCGPRKTGELIRGIFGKVLVTLLAITLTLMVAAHWLLPILASGLGPEQLALTTRLFFILLWIVPLSGISTYWGAVLNASKIFTLVAFAPIAIPVTMLGVFITCVTSFGIDSLAWGATAGYGVEFLLLMITMRRRRLPILPTWQRHEYTEQIGRQYGLLVVSTVLMSSSILIDQSMATWLGPGSVTVLNYGYKLTALMLGTISIGLTSTAFPHLSQLVANRDRDAIENTVKVLIKSALIFGVPVVFLAVVFSRPIVQLLFQRGAMTPAMAQEISFVQSCYLLHVPIYIISTLGARLLNAMDGNQILLRNSAINVACNVVGNLVFMRWLGVAGIALSTSCMYVVSTVLIFLAIRSKLRQLTTDSGMPQATVARAA